MLRDVSSDGLAPSPPIIGVDFDNTIALYDHAFAGALEARGFPTGPQVTKVSAREIVRASSGGESSWRAMQAEVYGGLRDRPREAPGFRQFVAACRSHQVPIFVISHKQRPATDDDIDMRLVALDWMRERSFFDPNGLGFREGQVFFEESREAKLERIRSIGCTHYIDDLLEVFLEPGFPPSVVPVLLANTVGPRPVHVLTAATWGDVSRLVFASSAC